MAPPIDARATPKQATTREYHPENEGTPFEVLLGRLDAEQVRPGAALSVSILAARTTFAP